MWLDRLVTVVPTACSPEAKQKMEAAATTGTAVLHNPRANKQLETMVRTLSPRTPLQRPLSDIIVADAVNLMLCQILSRKADPGFALRDVGVLTSSFSA